MTRIDDSSKTTNTPASRKRWRWLLVIGVFLVAAALGYIEFFLRRPVGEGPAGPRVESFAFQRVWSDRQVVLVGIGDSVTHGLGAKSQSHSYFSKYNQQIRQIAERHPQVHMVPLHATFLGHGSHCRQFWRDTYDWSDPHYWYYENIEDPNDRGYDAIRRVFLNTIVNYSSLVARR